MPERQRRAGPPLPEDPSEEDLARDWTLSEADGAEVLRCRGDDNRRRFALQLCVLRQYGRFLDRYQGVPVRILNHLNRQLGLTPTASLPEAERDATESGHQQRLREYWAIAPLMTRPGFYWNNTCAPASRRAPGPKIFSIRRWTRCVSGKSFRRRSPP